MKLHRLALLITLALVVAGCGGGGSGGGDPSQTGAISGRAINAQGQPIQGATVSLVPVGRASRQVTNTTTTDVEGRFLLENVEAGTYTLSMEADGPGGNLVDVQVSVTVPAGTTIDLTIRISQTGAINPPDPGFGVVSGIVLDELGNPAVGIRVKAEREPSGPELVTATNGDGRFVFDDLTPGLWKVWADPEGPARSDRVWIDVDANGLIETTLRIEGRDFDDDNDDEDDDDDEDGD